MKRILLLIAFALGSVAYGGTALAGGDHGHGHDQPHTTQPEHKVTICHIPPGNPANAHTIEVDAHALAAHLAHGDYLGACKPYETAPETTKRPHHTVPPTTTPVTRPPSTTAATVPETRPPTTVAPTTAAAIATTTPATTAAPTTVAPTTAPSTTARPSSASVTTAPTTSAAAAIAALPVTGSKAFRNAGVALLTLTIGVGLVFATRRRRIS